MAVIQMQRVFRFNGTDLPDPDPQASADQVLTHYAHQHPQLRYGKVEEPIGEGDKLVYTLKPNEYKPNG